MDKKTEILEYWFSGLSDESTLSTDLPRFRNYRIIDRFGRFPHRNYILGRPSTEEEIEFIKGPDSSF